MTEGGRRKYGPAGRDLTGQRFGRLVAIERLDQTGPATWRCLCDCGATKIALGKLLITGKTKSCGCLVRELAREMAKRSNAKAREAAALKREAKPKPPAPQKRDMRRGRAKGEVCAGSSGSFSDQERAAIEFAEAAGKVTRIERGQFPDVGRLELYPRNVQSARRGNLNSRAS